MFAYEFTKNSGVTLTSGTCLAAGSTGDPSDYTETDALPLTDKRHDLKNLSVYIMVPPTSNTTCYLHWYLAGGYNSSSTFALNYNSGTSLFLGATSGTSLGIGAHYRKFLPMQMYEGGTTYWVKSIPWVRLGCRSFQHKGSGVSTLDYRAWLIVG